MANKRVYYSVEQVQFAPVGTLNYNASGSIGHGIQTCGVSTKFNLEQVFELGQLAIYQNIENVPDVEMTFEKVLDGYPPLYLLLTKGSASATLPGRSNVSAQVLLSVYDDTKSSASGTPIGEIEVSGVFTSSIAYNFAVDGNFTESVTAVANNKFYRTAGFLGSGGMNNLDQPYALTNYTGSGGVQRRQHIIFGSGGSILPTGIPGITSVGGTGYNIKGADGNFGAHIQSIKVSANLGRDQINELGRKGPYFRYVNFPVEIKTDIEILATTVDQIQALQEIDNLSNEIMHFYISEGTDVDLGIKNKLDTVNYGGGNAGARGGNATITFSYVTFNDLVVKHPLDPSPGLYP